MNTDLENKKQYFKDSVYLKYENLKNSESTESKFENRSKKMNKLQKVAAVIIVGTMSLTAYAGITGNITLENMGFMKMSEKYEESLVSINKSIENEYCNITLESMAGDKSYIIAQYKINLKDKAFEKMKPIECTENNGYNLHMSKKVSINSKEIKNISEYVDKISENEYVYTQVINIMDINENSFDLQIDIENISSGIILGFEENGNEPITIGKSIKSKIELQGEAENSIISEQKIDNNTTMIIEKIANTKFQTYIKAKKIVEGLTYEEYNKLNPMEYYNFVVNTENDEPVSNIIYDGNTSGKKWYVDNNGEWEEKNQIDIKNSDKIKLEENYIILISLENNINKVNVSTVKSRIFNDRNDNENGKTEEEEAYENATWYPVKVGDDTYTAKSILGGTFTVNKISADDKNIVFDYNESGAIGDEWKIIVREKIDDMNYIFPIDEEVKGVTGNGNRIIFSRNADFAAGLNLDKVSLNNLDNLEFTLLFGGVTEKIGESVNIEVPTQDEQTAKINNLEIID